MNESLKSLLEAIANNSPQLDAMKVLEYLIVDEAKRISRWNDEVKAELEKYQKVNRKG